MPVEAMRMSSTRATFRMNSRRSCGIIGASLRPIMGTEPAPMMTVPLRSPSKRKKIPSILHFISDSLTTGRAAALRHLSFMGKTSLPLYPICIKKSVHREEFQKSYFAVYTLFNIPPHDVTISSDTQILMPQGRGGNHHGNAECHRRRSFLNVYMAVNRRHFPAIHLL